MKAKKHIHSRISPATDKGPIWLAHKLLAILMMAPTHWLELFNHELFIFKRESSFMMIIRPYSPEFTFLLLLYLSAWISPVKTEENGEGGAREEGCSSCKLQKYAETDRLLNLFAS